MFSKWDRFNKDTNVYAVRARQKRASNKLAQNHLYRAEYGNDNLGWNNIYVAAYSMGDAMDKIMQYARNDNVEHLTHIRKLKRIELDVIEHTN